MTLPRLSSKNKPKFAQISVYILLLSFIILLSGVAKAVDCSTYPSAPCQINLTNGAIVYKLYTGVMQYWNTSNQINWTSNNTNQSYTLNTGQTFNINDPNCIVPWSGIILNNINTTLCGLNTYAVNDTGNGGILIPANVKLDCSGSTVSGNDSNTNAEIRSQFASSSNVTIQNCNIQHQYIGVRTQANNWTVQNNNFSNVAIGVQFSNAVNYEIAQYNNFTNITSIGVYLSSSANNSKVNYNNFNWFNQAIYFELNSWYNQMIGNYAYNGTQSTNSALVIATEPNCKNNSYGYGSNQNLIANNTIIYAGWNAIDIACYYNNVTNNTILYPTHGGVDLNSGSTSIQDGAFNNVFNNFINTSGSTYQDIYVSTQHDINVSGNTLITGSLSTEGNSSINYNININSNKIYNGNLSLYTSSTNCLVENNYLYGASPTYDYYIDSYYLIRSTYVNTTFRNNFADHPVTVKLGQGNYSITFQENNQNMFFNYTPLTTSNSWYLYMPFVGYKSLVTNNNSISLFNLSAYNRVFNGTDSIPQAINNQSVNVTLGPGQRAFVFSYASLTQSMISGIDTSVTTCAYSLNPFTVTYAGTGNVNTTNMYQGNVYSIFFNSAFVSSSTANALTLNLAGIWSFSNYVTSLQTMPPGAERAVYFLLLVMIVFGAIYALFINPTVGTIIIIIGASIAAMIVKAML